MQNQIAIDAEKGVLSELIRHPHTLSDVSNIVSTEDFYEPSHGIIFESITEIINSGRKLGFINLVENLNAQGNLARIGSEKYLLEIINSDAPHNIGVSVEESVRIVKKASQSRKLEMMGRSLIEKTRNATSEDPDSIIQETEKVLFEIAQHTSMSEEQFNAGELFSESLARIFDRGNAEEGAVFGVPTGFPTLDNMTTGFHPGQFILIAARPGIGKSTLAVDFARNASFRAGKSVLFFSLEMDRHELMQRILSAETRIELDKIKKGNLSIKDWESISDIKDTIIDNNFIIDDSPNITMTQIRSKALRQLNSEAGLDMIVLDYLQLMKTPGKVESRQQEVSDFSRSLKLLSKELGVPVISLSQLNRSSENRTDKRPMISDLRESGSLEQDADIVFLIHRPEAMDENESPGQAELLIAKHRGGPTGKIELMPLLAYSKFVEQAKYVGEAPPLEEDFVSYQDEPVPPEPSENVPYDPYTGEIPPPDDSHMPAW